MYQNGKEWIKRKLIFTKIFSQIQIVKIDWSFNSTNHLVFVSAGNEKFELFSRMFPKSE